MERLCIEFMFAETRKIEYCIFAGLGFGGSGWGGERGLGRGQSGRGSWQTSSRAVGAGGVRAQRAGYPMVTRERERHPLPIPCP